MDFNKILVKKPEPETMNFPGAIECVIDGKKIHKLEWKDPEYYGLLKDSFLMLHKPDGKFYAWSVSEGDLLGEDYIVI